MLLLKDGSDEDKLASYNYASRLLIFYVQLIATQENISLLYYFASRVKQHRDATIATVDYEAENPTEQILNLYRMAELAQLVIKTYADGKNWPMQHGPANSSCHWISMLRWHRRKKHKPLLLRSIYLKNFRLNYLL